MYMSLMMKFISLVNHSLFKKTIWKGKLNIVWTGGRFVQVHLDIDGL
jgi:hypothetical protein